MKRKFVCAIFALCLALYVTGCGNSKEQQAANYYENELGLDKEDAEELAQELYGEDEEDTDVVEEEPEGIVVYPLPELVNSEWYEQKVQIYDMVFSDDMYLTDEDIRATVVGSAYDVELMEDFDSDGNVVPSYLIIDEITAVQFWADTRGRDQWEEVNDMVKYGLLEDGTYFWVGYGDAYGDNWYDKSKTEFVDIGTRDGVLAYLTENGFVEVEKEQSAYPSFDGNYSGTQFENLYAEDSPVEFADTPYYYIQGVQNITFYRMHKLGETDQTIEMERGYRNYIYSGAHLNLVNCVTFEFGTDGTVVNVKWGMKKFIVYED